MNTGPASPTFFVIATTLVLAGFVLLTLFFEFRLPKDSRWWRRSFLVSSIYGAIGVGVILVGSGLASLPWAIITAAVVLVAGIGWGRWAELADRDPGVNRLRLRLGFKRVVYRNGRRTLD
jgi:predicted lysophospholipase L1 biosynthesis ABC-type transport system permease subunit